MSVLESHDVDAAELEIKQSGLQMQGYTLKPDFFDLQPGEYSISLQKKARGEKEMWTLKVCLL